MRIIAAILFFFLFDFADAQSQEDDKVTFNTAVDWLNSKLDYVYFDTSNEKWWTNSFYINENKEVTIKQISSNVPQTANIKEKSYTIRKFRIQDINPYTITIKDVNESMGRFVEGKLLELRTFDGKPKIHKTIDNRKATSTSFLHLSFPKSLTDSLGSYPELVRDKFYDAVVAATKIYPLDEEGNRIVILETLNGNYSTESGNTWRAEELFPGILKLESTDKERYFGFDKKQGLYFLATLSAQGVEITYFKVKPGVQLILAAVDDPNQTILFQTFNSFKMNGEWYYRK